MIVDDELVHLIMRYEQARENGKTLTPEELCSETPEKLSALRDYLLELQKFDLDYENDPDLTSPYAPKRTSVAPTIPGYDIGEEIGYGGMGTVFAATYLHLNQPRAVKVIRGDALSGQRKILRFEREARLLAELEHDNIVAIHEANFQDGQPYFVMPLIRGGSLQQSKTEFLNDPKKAALLIEKVALAVHHAHEHGIVHRDLKPANILINTDGKPLVSDFGIAMLLADEDVERIDTLADDDVDTDDLMYTRLTTNGKAIGTVPYMSPEQLRSDTTAVDRRSDIWALGVILYELLTGERPFSGKFSEVVSRINAGTFVPPHRLNKNIDRSLSNIVVKCLQVNPAQRYQTAQQLATALNAWQHGDAFPEETRQRKMRRLARTSALAIALFLTIGTGTLALLYLNNEPPDPYQTYLDNAQKSIAKLKEGELVELVGPGVAEPNYWIRFDAGKQVTEKRTETGDTEIHLASTGASFMEFLPEVPLENYRIRAILRHTLGVRGESYIGISSQTYHAPFDNGMFYFLPSYIYSDFFNNQGFRNGTVASAEFDFLCCFDDPFAIIGHRRFDVTSGRNDVPVEKGFGGTAPFRELTMEATTNLIQCYWKDTPAEERRLTAKADQRKINFGLQIVRQQNGRDLKQKSLDVSKINIQKNGAIGVISNESTLIIRELTIEPLNEAEK